MTPLSKNLSRIALSAAVITLGGALTASAEETVVAKVPFAFIVANRQLPAGNYTMIERPDAAGLLSIEDHSGHHLAYTQTVSAPEKAQGKPGLVFEKFNGEYFLAGVVAADGDQRDIVVTPSVMVKEIAATQGK